MDVFGYSLSEHKGQSPHWIGRASRAGFPQLSSEGAAPSALEGPVIWFNPGDWNRFGISCIYYNFPHLRMSVPPPLVCGTLAEVLAGFP